MFAPTSAIFCIVYAFTHLALRTLQKGAAKRGRCRKLLLSCSVSMHCVQDKETTLWKGPGTSLNLPVSGFSSARRVDTRSLCAPCCRKAQAMLCDPGTFKGARWSCSYESWVSFCQTRIQISCRFFFCTAALAVICTIQGGTLPVGMWR